MKKKQMAVQLKKSPPAKTLGVLGVKAIFRSKT